jgi:hypothetical protein
MRDSPNQPTHSLCSAPMSQRPQERDTDRPPRGRGSSGAEDTAAQSHQEGGLQPKGERERLQRGKERKAEDRAAGDNENGDYGISHHASNTQAGGRGAGASTRVESLFHVLGWINHPPEREKEREGGARWRFVRVNGFNSSNHHSFIFIPSHGSANKIMLLRPRDRGRYEWSRSLQ